MAATDAFDSAKGYLADSVMGFVGSEYDYPDLLEVRTVLKKADDYWLALSALQKAIRRGNSLLAYKAAHSILMIGKEPDLWRRLAVIALEDVGLAAPDVTAMTLFLASNKKIRDKIGRKHVLMAVVVALAASQKSRLLTYLTLGGVLPTEWGHNHLGVLKSGVIAADEVLGAAKNVDAKAGERLAALWWMLGGGYEFSGFKIPYRPVDVANALLGELKLPPLIVYMMIQGRSTAQDALFVPIPLAHEMMKSDEIIIGHDDMWGPPDNTLLGNKYAASLDRYTQVGKKAIGLFAKQNPGIMKDIPKGGDPKEILYSAVFLCDSGVLNKIAACKMYYGPQNAVFDEKAKMHGWSSVGENHEFVVNIRANMTKLNECRAYILSKE
jgi:hypothetical protein